MLQLLNKNAGKGPLWLVEKQYTIGSDASCDIVVADASLKSCHAELHIDGDQVTVVNLSNTPAFVDDSRVADRSVLAPGSSLKLGSVVFELVDPKSNKDSFVDKTQTTWALKALNTALADKHFPLSGSQVIGRSQECDVSLAVVHLSRKHARVTVTDAGLVIEDLNSANGTFINGKRVSKSTAVAGDEISFDTLHFRVIGPSVNADKTAVRGNASDIEMTTIRPAIALDQSAAATHSNAEAKPSVRERSPLDQRHNASKAGGHREADIGFEKPEPQGTESKGYGMLLVGAGVLIAAFLAWFFLK